MFTSSEEAWEFHKRHNNGKRVTNPTPGQRVLVAMMDPLCIYWHVVHATIYSVSTVKGVRKVRMYVGEEEEQRIGTRLDQIFVNDRYWCRGEPSVFYPKDQPEDKWLVWFNYQNHLYKIEIPFTKKIPTISDAHCIANEKWETAREEFEKEPLYSYFTPELYKNKTIDFNT